MDRADTDTIAIRLESLLKRFDEVIAVNNVSLQVEKREFLTLLGPSGCGKTTTLRCIAGLESPTSGSIYFDEQSVTDLSAHRRGVGFVFQNWALFPHLRVKRNISFGLELRGMRRREIDKRVKEVLDLVRLPGLEGRFPSQLSGGQQQRVALARAMVISPKVLLFDEPLSNLDAKLRKEMRIELKALHEKLGITTIYVTHDQPEALTLSDRIALMNDGRVQQIGPPIEIFNYPEQHFAADFMGFENFLEARISQLGGDGTMGVESEMGGLVLRKVRQIEKFSEDEQIEVAIRSEHIKISSDKARENNVVKGIVETFLYQGDKTDYFVKFEIGATRLKVTHSGAPLREKGDNLVLCLPPEALTPIKNRGEEDAN